MVRKLIIAAALAVALVAGATGAFVAQRQPGVQRAPGQTLGEMAATTTTVLDPGIAAPIRAAVR